MENNPLIGTWRLVSWYNETQDGERIYPLGTEAKGYISYSIEGFVFVHVMAANRPPFALNDPFGGSLKEDSSAMKSHISYAGSYECRGSNVIHRVTVSSCPNWVGTEQIRIVSLDKDRLVLSADGVRFQGNVVTAHILWDRAESASEN